MDFLSNDLDEYITGEKVKKKVGAKNKKCEHGRIKYYCKECGGDGYCKHGKQKARCKECGGSAFCKHNKKKEYCKECGGKGLCKADNCTKHKYKTKYQGYCQGCFIELFPENDLVKEIIKKRNPLCEHGIKRVRCKECGGSAFCEHGKWKSGCIKCNGPGICEHGKRKYSCKECGGSGICEHGNNKRICKECGGSQICEHGKCKSTCKQCGIGYCEHGREKRYCKECGGSQICPHNRIKRECRECGGSAFCKHNKRKDRCLECGGSQLCKSSWCETNGNKKYEGYCFTCFMELFPDTKIVKKIRIKKDRKCEHGIIKYGCIHCSNQACKHGKWKRICNECGGSGLCKSEWCEVQMNSISKAKYEGYCLHCFMHLFPDKKVMRNYKTKEKDVVDRVKETYPNFDWVHDKKVQDGCSKRRPDLLLDLGSHIIIIEIDENKHSGYDNTCENKRLMELSKDVHHRPIVFIRFNPDKYIDKEGNIIKSCWRLNKQGVMTIMKTKEEEWNCRIDKLKETIQYWIDNNSNKTVEIIELFY
jgi:hypothetical protein